MSAVAVIPARYASTRFPGKPLANDTGKYLIQHVYERVQQATCFDRIAVATDDDRIAAAVEGFGGTSVMTRPDHQSGTDRIAEVVTAWQLPPDTIVVNVQGDEPEIDPAALDRLVDTLNADPQVPVATLACPLTDPQAAADPSCVKVVRNLNGRALYFSRSLIPFVGAASVSAGTPSDPPLLHLGVYAYRAGFLLEFAGWPPTPLETREKLEQLRILENGYPLAVDVVEHAAVGIDTPGEYARFVARIGAAGTRLTS